MKLYSFQKKGVEAILNGFKTHNRQVLSWYTGAGKTNVMAGLCEAILKKNPDALIAISCFLTLEIKWQVSERLKSFGMDHLVHTVDHGSPKYVEGKNIFVFNPQGLYFALPKVKFDYFLIDESHAGTIHDLMMIPQIIKKTSHKDTKILALSATPWDLLIKKDWAGAPNHKRTLDQGLKDGTITDFKFIAEEAQIEFREEDFSREGDLRSDRPNFSILKSACLGKMEHLLKKYDKVLGRKVLVFCPPGNINEIAFTLADKFNGLAFVESRGRQSTASAAWKETKDNLEKFKEDPDVRFLFVNQKCQTGFDFPELESCIDLTMTRNIRVLAQRVGRVARKHKDLKKNYFYVYDKSLMKDRLEWIICTVIDFSLGAYDGWSTKSAKFRKVSVSKNFGNKYPLSITFSEVIDSLSEKDSYKTKTLSFVSYDPPKKRTLDEATKEMKKYASRIDMWRECPALYKWLRLNAKDVMDKHFPFKNKLNIWNAESVERQMKKAKKAGCTGRRDFKNRWGSGCSYWVENNPEIAKSLLDKYFPITTVTWNDELAKERLLAIKDWRDVRKLGGLRSWISRRGGGEKKWREWWMNQVPKRERT